MPRFCFVLALITGLLLPALVQAETAVWNEQSERLELSRFVDYRVESSPISFSQVQALPESEWQQNGSDSVSLGYGGDVYWFRVSLRNARAAEALTFLEISYPVLDHIELYRASAANPEQPLVLGDKQPFHERPIHHRNFVVPIAIAPDTTETLYLRVETTSSMQVPLTLWDQDVFYEAEQSRSMFEGVYYGIVLVMILYNLFVYMAVRERSFLYYVGYISSMPLFLASLHGVAFQYLWPEATWWNDQSIIVFLNLVVLFGGVFSIRFISVTRQNHPYLNRWTMAMVMTAGLLALAGLFVPYEHMILPTILAAFVGCSTMLMLSVVRWIKRDPAARYYTVAWVFMLFGGIVLALSKFTVLPRNLITENATQVGSALGVILLSVALADRINREKKRAFAAQQRLLAEERKARMAQEDSLRVQQEANTMLEQRVQERTRDLEAVNLKLLELNARDPLTGLKNRGHFDEVFQQDVVRAYRFQQPLSLLVVDIDHFKSFNDTYGHLVGDDCLRMVAECIGRHITRPQDMAARYGGEEFVVLLPDTPEEGALRVAERIRNEIEATGFRVSGEVLRVTVSIGVCSATPARADATKEIFTCADDALYQAKNLGRNRVASDPHKCQSISATALS
ncbi:diguanylate cyclase [Marinobacter sp. ES-1]|uniref:diguanylate cyclase n=1 Tax=Marinobacter vinifirmus TaxID=355591 RepID=A0A558BAJ8_9GAMM|nr:MULTISPECIES: diguanylate cyclase [Marinobacter]ERP91661.1 diguanylate cyclase [Marinobacter sp. ES-1]TVT33535.1 MAG: diguanylate cyclase [Marinobacter vinifirmus]